MLLFRLGLPSGAAPGGILINNPPWPRRSIANKYTRQVHVFCDPLLKPWTCPKGQARILVPPISLFISAADAAQTHSPIILYKQFTFPQAFPYARCRLLRLHASFNKWARRMFLQFIISSATALAVLLLLWCLAGFSRELSRRKDCFAWLLFIGGPSVPPAAKRAGRSIIDMSAGKTAA